MCCVCGVYISVRVQTYFPFLLRKTKVSLRSLTHMLYLIYILIYVIRPNLF